MTEGLGVEGNARMTGVLGAVLLLALAVEGVTVPSVREMFTLHVFVGLFVIPVVCLKLATTGYRFFHYYRGTAAYRQKGPPHPVLRISAPVVILATLLLLGSGIVMLAVGPKHSDSWLTVHQASFIVWVAVTTVHVIGHVRETWRLTTAEMRARPPVPRRGVRTTLVVCSLALGVAIGVASLGWTSAWSNRSRHLHGAAPAVSSHPSRSANRQWQV
jgi:hypothetical protein